MKKCALAIILLFSCSLSLCDDNKEEAKPWYKIFCSFFTDNAKEGAKGAVTETGKELLKDIILKPFLIKPIKKLLGLDRGDAEGRRIKFMLKLARTIDELKKAGASKKQIAEMSAKLATQLNEILDYMNKKK